MNTRRTLLLLLLCLCLPVAAEAASYAIDTYAMEIEIADDGSGYIEETIVYEFDGSYNGALIYIRHDDTQTPHDIRVFVDETHEMERVSSLDNIPYTYTATAGSEGTTIKTYAPGEDGQRTFRISYQLGGMALRYRDTARVNRMLLRSQSEYGSAIFRVQLPGKTDSEIQSFVHGAIDGSQLSLRDGLITIGPAAIHEGDLVELSALFPQEWLPSARMLEQDMRQEALAIEAEISRQAQEEAERKAQLARILSILLMAALGVYAVASLAVFFSMRGKYGLRHAILPTTDEKLLDEIPAAIAQVLKDGAVSASGMSGTLLELTDKGILSMEMLEDDTVFTRENEDAQPPEPHQQKLLRWLFANSTRTSIRTLDADGDAERAARFNEQYNEWKRLVVEDTIGKGWRYKNDTGRWAALLTTLLIGLILGASLWRVGLWQLGIPSAVLGMLFGLLFSRLRRLTDEGEARLAAINGFIANYEDRLTTQPQTILSRAPLVMALGYMEPVAQWLDAHPQEMENIHAGDWVMPAYWIYSDWPHGMVRLNQSIREAQSSNSAAVSQDSSGSASSGGGFSGGSGGSSHGAW